MDVNVALINCKFIYVEISLMLIPQSRVTPIANYIMLINSNIGVAMYEPIPFYSQVYVMLKCIALLWSSVWWFATINHIYVLNINACSISVALGLTWTVAHASLNIILFSL